MKSNPTNLPTITTREHWLAARLELLQAEKELTRRSDELARRRRALPWVPVTKPYRFETESGDASLADLFDGRSQLLVYHFMFGPDYDAGCPSCSSIADGFNGFVGHLANHDVTLAAVSRAPFARLQAFRQRMGWSFPWASSAGGDFNADYSVSFSAEQQRTGAFDYNFREGGVSSRDNDIASSAAITAEGTKLADQCGVDWPTYAREAPGMSAFVQREGVVYHTYSTYARGLDALWGMYPWLDRAPLGRNESGFWLRHRDAYASSPARAGQPVVHAARTS